MARESVSSQEICCAQIPRRMRPAEVAHIESKSVTPPTGHLQTALIFLPILAERSLTLLKVLGRW